MFAMWWLTFIFDTAKSSAICFWLSQMRPSRDISDTVALPSSVVYKTMLLFSPDIQYFLSSPLNHLPFNFFF